MGFWSRIKRWGKPKSEELLPDPGEGIAALRTAAAGNKESAAIVEKAVQRFTEEMEVRISDLEARAELMERIVPAPREKQSSDTHGPRPRFIG
jgi:hypothetical protein